jgi:two-component system, NarL family, sensor histidine kinase BarA
MELAHLPIIDWHLGTKLAGNQRGLAEELLSFLLKDLDSVVDGIKELHKSTDYKKMQQQVHRLHGAVCYCGVPRLKFILAQLETHIKNNIMDDLPSLLEQLDTEVKLLLEHHPSFSN